MVMILNAMWLSLVLLWPLTVYAAGDSLGKSLGMITPTDWIAICALSLVSGLVALLGRLRKMMEAQALKSAGEPFDPGHLLLGSWRVYALFHMTGSFAAGFLVYLICESLDVRAHLEALAIALGAWSGATLIDAMASRAASRLGNAVDGLLGFGDKTPPPQ